MKALSIKQPWAWLIVTGQKDIENRTWPTKFRGRFLIHASKSIDKSALKIIEKWHGVHLPETFQTGAIIGDAELVDCVPSHGSRWFIGPYGFVLKDQQQREPIKINGRLGFFEVQT